MKKFSVFVLVYTLVVILFGAYVRISGSGAGCGEHWPTCEGEVVPGDLIKNHAKTIEYTHRLTSGLSGLLVMALVVGVLRLKDKNPAARRWALLSLLFERLDSVFDVGLSRGDHGVNEPGELMGRRFDGTGFYQVKQNGPW